MKANLKNLILLPTLIASLGFMPVGRVTAQAATPERHEAAPVPWEQIGAVAGKQYSGDGLTVASSPEGVLLKCAFQRLNARISTEGMWLISTADGAKGTPFRLIARKVGRESAWTLPLSGKVEVAGQVVRFLRPQLTEEYSVSVDGVRQDFVIEQRPVGSGPVRLELEADGVLAERMVGGARLTTVDGGRKLIYNRLKAEDARGREMKISMEVVASNRLAVIVEDAGAEYPLRIDPTFSDANWAIFNPGIAGANFRVQAIAVDGSGNLYIGGSFNAVGTVEASGIAKWNGSVWSALGSGISGGDGTGLDVDSLACDSSGNVYAGGDFTVVGGVAANYVAKWNGSAWSALGSGLSSESGYSPDVLALAVSGNTLYAGGDFIAAGGISATNIAKWDGSTWSPLGLGMDGSVQALAVNGSVLYAGGNFTMAGGVAGNGIAAWNGSAWSALGSGMSNADYEPIVYALAVSGPNLYAAGVFAAAGGVPANCVAKWNGSGWSALGSGIGGFSAAYLDALAVSGTNLYVGGEFSTAGGIPAACVARWNGSTWSALGPGIVGSYVSALGASGANLYAGGYFTQAGGVAADYIAAWNGNTWSALCPGMDGDVFAVAVSDSHLYIGGGFTTVGGVAANHIATWNGSAWSALGSGMDNVVSALAVSGSTLYAGGRFITAGGVTANYIASWNGSSWSALGSGMGGSAYNPGVYALAVSGHILYAGGMFTTAGGITANYIAQWNGSSWSPLGSGMYYGGYNSIYGVFALAVNGANLYAGGCFYDAGSASALNIAQWNGSSWSALGSGLGGYGNNVHALAVSGTNLYAGGDFGIASWNGATWSGLGSGMGGGYANDLFLNVYALALSGTNLYAGGNFTTADGLSANGIAVWNGTVWANLGSGLGCDSYNFSPGVYALGTDQFGHLFVGGEFMTAGTNVSPFLAQANVGLDLSIRFTANLTYGAPPLSVQFYSPNLDSLGNAITGWNWSFGDGTISTNQSPLHVYTSAGTFQPSLVVTNSYGDAISAIGLAIQVRVCAVSAPQGLVSWWTGDGNAMDSISGNNGIVQGGVIYTNGMVGQALSFDGTDAYLNTSQMVTNPQNFSLAMWFKTTTTQGGLLLGFSSSQTGNSSTYDRHIYMDSAGLLHFGTYSTGFQVISSSTSYNDGGWHYVVAISCTNSGASLYVDGQLVANNPAYEFGYVYNGYWRIAENNLTSWPSAPSSAYFAGAMDELMIFNRALSSLEIQAIYQAGTNGMCPPTQLMFTDAPSFSKTNGVVLSASLRSGQSYHLQSNTNLDSTKWITLTNFVAGTAPISYFTNQPTTNAPQGFYRLVSP